MSPNPSLEAIRSAVLALINAQSKAERRRIVESQRHLLLIDAADQLLADWLEVSQGHSDYIRLLQEHRSLLARCRREGIEAAFADRLRPAMPDIPPELMARLMSVESEEELTQLLSEHPELQPVLAAMQQAAEERSAPSPRQALADKLLTFVRVESWSESKAYLAEHPDLLTDQALAVLERLTRGQEREEVRRILRQHHALLTEVRQKGLDEAFAPLMRQEPESPNRLTELIDALMACESPAAVYELAAQEPELLVDEVDALLQQAIVNARAQGTEQSKGWANHVAERHETLRQLRQMIQERGISVEDVLQGVRAEQESTNEQPSSAYEQVSDAVLALITAETWEESKRIVEQERELLLSDMALEVFADLLEQYKEDAGAIGTLTDHRDLLIRCRKEGIEAAFADRLRSAMPDIPPELMARLMSVQSDEELTQLLTQHPELWPVWAAQQATLSPRQEADKLMTFMPLLEALIACDSPAAVYELVVLKPELLVDEMDALLQQAIANAHAEGSDEGKAFAQSVAARHQTLRELRQMMNETGMSVSEVVPALRKQVMGQTAGSTSPDILPEFASYVQRAIAAQDRLRMDQSRQAMNAAVAAWQAILDRPEIAQHPGFAVTVQHELGEVLLQRYLVWGQAQDLDQAIVHHQKALASTPKEAPDRPRYLNNLGIALSSRFSLRGQAADLERAIARYQEALAAIPAPDPNLLNNLGVAFRDRFSLRGQAADLERAIARHEEALAITPKEAPDRPPRLNNLGLALYDRFRLRGQAADLERAIARHEEALASMPKEAPERPRCLNYLGMALSSRFILYGQAADLEQAITSYQEALAITPKEAPDRPSMLNNLGAALRERFSLHGQAADLERAIARHEEALASTPKEASKRAMWLNNLGLALHDRFSLHGQAADLERAIAYHEEALTTTPKEASGRPRCLNYLGMALSSRFSLHGEAADLERAITYYQEALAATLKEAPDRPTILNNLGIALSSRFSLRGQASDLDRAIACHEEALAATPKEAPDRPSRLNNLGAALRDRFSLRGQAADLERAIARHEDALAATPKEATNPSLLNNLGAALRERFRLRGQAVDLDRAIARHQEALATTPKEAPDRSIWLNNLGGALQTRFSLRGQAADLDRAIARYQEALATTPKEAPKRPWRLNNLGTVLRERFRLRGQAADLDRAIACYKEALAATPKEAPDPSLLNNLGAALHERFSLRGQAADLDRAITRYQEALAATFKETPDRPSMLNNLGTALRERFSLRGQAADLDQAIAHHEEALVATPKEAPDRPGMLNNLGVGLRERFSLRKQAADLEQAIEAFGEGLRLFGADLFLDPRRVLAHNLGDLYYEQRHDFAKAREAYEQAAAAAESIHQGVRSKRGRERQAAYNARLYARLVYCCLLEEDKVAAFEYAIAGKGRAFADLLASAQVDLTNVADDKLQKKIDEARSLRAQLDAVSGQLLGETPSTNTQPSPQDASASQKLLNVQRATLQVDLQCLRKQEKELWEEIRDQFPDYFATQSAEPFTLEEAQGLASQLDATLVSYYRHDKGWVAFVIRADVPAETSFAVVKLSVTNEQLIEWWELFNSGLADRVLVNLRWSKKMADALITPLRDHLLDAKQEQSARLVLAPFSLLHLLPLDTLPCTSIPWRKSELAKVKYLSDEYVVTITPSLAMVGRVMARRQRGEKRETLCAIAYPGRKGSKHYLQHVLPEAQAIAPLFTHSTTRLDSAATRQAAIFDVTAHDVAHYSCHGLFDPEEVEQSSLLLSGGMLTLRDIFNEVRLPNASLVTLSACETGMALPRQGDELAGMVQGFVYAGTPTVIASLWAVNDAATRYLFERFYEHYTTGIAAVDALRTAQQELRQHSYAHPYYWAAFQAVGAAYDSLPITSRPIRPAKEVIQPPTSSKTKGAYPMSIPTAQAILDKAQRILQNIEPFVSDIAQELTAEERTIFLATLEKLVILETISKESQLQLASDIISAFEAIPLLRENFIGDVDPETEQNKRQLTLQAALEGAKPLPSTRQEEQQVDNIYQIPLQKVCQLLREQEEEGEEQEEDKE